MAKRVVRTSLLALSIVIGLESMRMSKVRAEVPAETKAVTSVSQILDVTPTQESFQALQSLVERYGVLSADAAGNFRPDAPLQRGAWAAWLDRSLNVIGQLKNMVGKELAPLTPADREAFIDSLGPQPDKTVSYTLATLADTKTVDTAWFKNEVKSLIEVHKIDIASSRQGKVWIDADKQVSHDEFVTLMSKVFGVKEINGLRKPARGDMPITRSQAAMALDECLNDVNMNLANGIQARVEQCAVELSSRLTANRGFDFIDETRKEIQKNGYSDATRLLLLDLTYNAHNSATKAVTAARKTKGLTTEQDTQLVALFPGKFAENQAKPAAGNGPRVSDLPPGKLPLSKLAYLDSKGIVLRAKQTDPSAVAKFKPGAVARLDVVRPLLTAVLRDDLADQDASTSTSAAMLLRHFSGALDRHQAKFAAVLEQKP